MPDNPAHWSSIQSVCFLSSFPPRRCGIATFTRDLSEGVAGQHPGANVQVVAMNDRPEGYAYNQRVCYEIKDQRIEEYRLAADFLNMTNVDVVSVQHEFGIFGGAAGEMVIDFINAVHAPVVTTMHTVLKEPPDDYRRVTERLVEASDRVVVMADRGVEFLTQVYGAPEEKIDMIPHGIPDVPFVDPAYFKDVFGVEGRKVILTFGLLGPSKGIEYMVEALPAIVGKHPDAIYLVLGATHPGVLAHSGESYRDGLKKRARELGVGNYIQFVNRYVDLEELTQYLGAADIYVTPYLNEAQMTSGTLAYALGTGKAVVSTPYWHAQEMMAQGRGRLVPFAEGSEGRPGEERMAGVSERMAEQINALLDDDMERNAVRKRAYQYTRDMAWHNVARRYLDLFAEVRRHGNHRIKQDTVITAGGSGAELTTRSLNGEAGRHEDGAEQSAARTPFDTGEHTSLAMGMDITARGLPDIKLDHLGVLTDDTGMLGSARYTIPNRAEGYTTDNNARALIAVLYALDHEDHFAQPPGPDLQEMASTYLGFLGHAFDPRARRFREKMSYDRRWDADAPPSEDTDGRCVWALGEAVARTRQRGDLYMAANLFRESMAGLARLEHPRGHAYSLIGIHAYLRRFGGDSHAKRLRADLANRLFDMFRRNEADDWHWPYNKVTYSASRIPHALLMSGRWMFRDDMIQMALRSLEWLWSIQCDGDPFHGAFAPIGTDGWYHRGKAKPRFNQSPRDVQGMLEACLEAHRVTGEGYWLDRAKRCLTWFLGDNDLNLPLYDPVTGGCADYLTPQGSTQHESAEATLAWLLALLNMYEFAMDIDTGRAEATQRRIDDDKREKAEKDRVIGVAG